MAQDDTAEIICVYGPNKIRTQNSCCKFIRSEAPLRRIKDALDNDTNAPSHRVSVSWANKFENVYDSQDGTYWVCKLCVEAKDYGHNLRGMCLAASISNPK